MLEKIELPPLDLLDKHRAVVSQFRDLGRMLGHFSVGWSYYLEWAWIFGQLDDAHLTRGIVLDAGAGLGLSQWYLAEHGARVYSVDRLSRACLPLYLRERYQVVGLRDSDLLDPRRFLNPFDWSVPFGEKARGMMRSLKGILTHLPSGRAPGTVCIYNSDLASMPSIPDESIDTIVSTSALEHNSPANLALVVKELLRVLKPGGVLIATLAAARREDTYHKPSSAWCYTDATLRETFGFLPGVPSNYDRYDDIMDSLRMNDELRENLSVYYYLGSGHDMPWGRWRPPFPPVGVVKVKGGG